MLAAVIFYEMLLILSLFKTKILAGYRSLPKSIFGIHDSIGVKRLFQLRVGLSPLLKHKVNHNFLDTPSDKCITCNTPEDLEHFLLHCARFTEFRHTLFNSVHSLNANFQLLSPKGKIKFFLYGDKSLNDATNRSIITATLLFLKATERFL